MLIIFYMIKKHPNYTFIPTIIFLLLNVITIATQNCQEKTIITDFTKCKITMITCSSVQNLTADNFDSSSITFKSCQMSKCNRLGIGEDCRESINMGLSQAQCYSYCCNSVELNEKQCKEYNSKTLISTERMNVYLIIGLSVCAVLLLLVIGYFAIKEVKCCYKPTMIRQQNKVNEWKNAQFNDHKCTICDQYGAVLETKCKHYFHFQCMEDALKDKQLQDRCLKCDESLIKFKLWCNECHQKTIKITSKEIKGIKQLKLFYDEAKFLHDDCMKDLNCYAKTDLRFTSSTND